jgi:hypothetical protein
MARGTSDIRSEFCEKMAKLLVEPTLVHRTD